MKIPSLPAARTAALILAAAACFTAHAALAQTLPEFAFTDERVRFDLTSLNEGDPLTTISGWTSVANGNRVVGVAPRTHTGQPSAYVPGPVVAGIGIDATTKSTLNSPTVSPSTPFTAEDTIYFSAVINLYGSASSGVRVMVGDYGGAGNSFRNLVGFGAAPDGAVGRLQLYHGGSVIDIPSSGEGAVTLLANNWYELTLVVQQNEADMANSTGYLYYRNLSTNGALTLVDTPVSNGFTINLSETDLPDFSVFRLTEFRYGAQVASLSAGVGVISIPEPSSAMMTGAAIAVFGFFYFVKRQR